MKYSKGYKRPKEWNEKMVVTQKKNKHPWRQPYNLGLGAKSTYKIYG